MLAASLEAARLTIPSICGKEQAPTGSTSAECSEIARPLLQEGIGTSLSYRDGGQLENLEQ